MEPSQLVRMSKRCVIVYSSYLRRLVTPIQFRNAISAFVAGIQAKLPVSRAATQSYRLLEPQPKGLCEVLEVMIRREELQSTI